MNALSALKGRRLPPEEPRDIIGRGPAAYPGAGFWRADPR